MWLDSPWCWQAGSDKELKKLRDGLAQSASVLLTKLSGYLITYIPGPVVFRTKYQIHILEIVMADFSMNTSTASKLFCRICHDEGNLQHPCQCAGTIGLVHLKCLETWFSINGKNNCELCGHLFQVIKKDRSFKEVLDIRFIVISRKFFKFNT